VTGRWRDTPRFPGAAGAACPATEHTGRCHITVDHLILHLVICSGTLCDDLLFLCARRLRAGRGGLAAVSRVNCMLRETVPEFCALHALSCQNGCLVWRRDTHLRRASVEIESFLDHNVSFPARGYMFKLWFVLVDAPGTFGHPRASSERAQVL